MRSAIITKSAPKAIGPYSQAIQAGGFLFISGQLPIDPKAGQMVAKDIAVQTRQSLTNIKSILESAGMSMGDIVKANIFLSDLNDFGKMNEVYADFFDAQFPARAAVEVSRLPKDSLIEIEAIAYKG